MDIKPEESSLSVNPLFPSLSFSSISPLLFCLIIHAFHDGSPLLHSIIISNQCYSNASKTDIISPQIFGCLIQNIDVHRGLVVALIAIMAVAGVGNIQHQRNIRGEYSNYPLEDLIEWINASTPTSRSCLLSILGRFAAIADLYFSHLDAVFGGPMPTMANLKLSTHRPIINHPHYEDEGIR